MEAASVLSKLRSCAWFLRRPALYREFARRAWWSVACPPEPDTSEASRAWCEARAVDAPHAVMALCGAAPAETLLQRHQDAFSEARRRAADCPLEMGGAGDLELLYALVRSLGARRVVETGVAYGWSSLAILLALSDQGGGRLVSTDMPYMQRDNEPFVGTVVAGRLRRSWDLVRLPDRDALPSILAELAPIDLCHYDSDKSYRGRAWAYRRIWDALRPGGMLVSDDIDDNVAFRDFCAATGSKPVVARSEFGGIPKFVGILKKAG